MPNVKKTVQRGAKKAVSPEVKKTKLSIKLREAMSSAYSAVMGTRYAHSVSTVTLEAMMREHIEEIEGTDGKTPIRINKLDQVEKIVTALKEAVKTAKKLPPELFSLKSWEEKQKSDNANTPEVPS